MPSLANSSAAASTQASAAEAPDLRIDRGDGLAWPPNVALLVPRIAAAVHACIRMTGIVALQLTDDAGMACLNQAFAGRQAATDVLAFPSGDPERPGDVAISLERVRRQASAYGHSVEREFGYLLTHALLHLAGLSHNDDERQGAMRQVEESVMTAVGLARTRSTDA